MDALGDALDTIPGLRVAPYWVDRITPPTAVVGWPDPLTYDAALRRGGDRVSLPLMVLVGQVDKRTSRDAVAKYADGAGPSSVKRVIEAHETNAYDSARVESCTFGVIVVAAVEYLAASFTVDIIGNGS